MSELQDPSLNYMVEFFETPTAITGVPVEYAPARDIADYPAAETEDCTWITPGPLSSWLREGPPASVSDKKYLVLEIYHGLDRIDPDGDPLTHLEFLRGFYRSIVPNSDVQAKLESWYARSLAERFVVGVNIRTGNGQFVKGSPYHRRVDQGVVGNERVLVRKIAAAVDRMTQHLPTRMREQSVTFYATDSYRMHDVLSRLPRAVTRRTVFPPPGAGHQFAAFNPEAHGDYSDMTSIEDTIIDMFLLASCNALIYNPSLFSQYARVTTDDFGGGLLNIESRYTRYYIRTVKARVHAWR